MQKLWTDGAWGDYIYGEICQGGGLGRLMKKIVSFTGLPSVQLKYHNAVDTMEISKQIHDEGAGKAKSIDMFWRTEYYLFYGS